MGIVIGIVLALATGIAGNVVAFDRERSFYCVILIVVATYYVVFAATGASSTAVIVESGVAGIFTALAVIGYKRTLWFVVAGLAGHGIFDIVHSWAIDNRGVPLSWPLFCASYDLMAAAYLAGLLVRRGSTSGAKPTICAH
jgi:branched-subunit amino acid transport protein